MAIEWNASLSVGIEEIDKQHKELFRQINELIHACHQGRGVEAVGEVLSFLDSYVRLHFRTEESLMLKYGFPEFQAHRLQHQEFMANLAEVRRRFTEEGPGVHIVVITNRILAGWLNTHIRRSDKIFGVHVESLKKAQ
ncbi:MAG: bacteriohemerythrin [Eubacteriales bacterium]|nr:bacteriohemerythrin [Eubacteriales bacterium]